MTEVLHGNHGGMHNITHQVVGSVNVKDANGGCKCLQQESQPFSDQGVDEGGVSSAIQQCGDDMEILSFPHGNSYVNEEFMVLVDSVGIDVFRDLISDGKRNRFFFFMGFVDRMKHRVRASAALWTS